jgi:hypothetical protein
MITRLHDLLFRDFWLKLFSLALAVLIWITVWLFAIRKDLPPTVALNGARTEELTFFNIPVYVVSAAADVRDTRVSPSEVEVKVRSEPRKLQELARKMHEDPQAKDIRALVDLTGIESARGLRKRIQVTTPADITFVQVIPDEVEVVVPPKR